MSDETGRRSRRFALARPAAEPAGGIHDIEIHDGELMLHYAWPDRSCTEAFAALKKQYPDIALSGPSRLRLAWLGLIEQNERDQLESATGWREQVRVIHARYFRDAGPPGARRRT
jgi:hypothetical protein